jgi:hypothetical protein
MFFRLRLPLPLTLLLAVLGITACDGPPYRRSGGQWTYRGTAFTPQHPASFEALDERFARDQLRGYCRGALIADSDGASFSVVSETEARDRLRVYHCDTYRKAQEYWSIQHLRIVPIAGADAATYVSLGKGYARDKARVYADGIPFQVRDPASFEPLDGDFARDAERGYYARQEIPGSHGPSFETIDTRDVAYARDRANAYYGYDGYRDNAAMDTPGRPRQVVRTLRGAEPAALRVLGRDYVADTRHVWHQGQIVAGADPSSFAIDESYQGPADANDRSGAWNAGRRVRPSK